MRPKLKPVVREAGQTILVKNDKLFSFYAPLHYHPDYEIIYIKKSHGVRIIGDSIDNYSAGEIVILGPHLPHYHVSTNVSEENEPPIETIAVLFPESIIDSIKHLPEHREVSQMLEKTKFGIDLLGNTREQVQVELEKMTVVPSFQNLASLMNILNIIVQPQSEYKLISSFEYSAKKHNNEKTRMILGYIAENFLDEIKPVDVAKLLNQSQSAFCNYFKSQTGTTFSNYINMLRISKACELLLTTTQSVSVIAFEVGFANLAYFNRRFKEIKQVTPKEYRKRAVSNNI